MSWTSEIWKQAVRDLGYCVLCGRKFGPGEAPDVCHRNEGKGMGAKVPDSLTWAGCRACHVRIDQGMELSRDERRSLTDRAIVLTLRALTAVGFLDVFADTAPKKFFSALTRRSRQHGARSTSKNVARIV